MIGPIRLEAGANGVTHIVLDRPERLNALDVDVVEHLHAALTTIGRDAECRAVVLRGAGANFCAGADLAGYGTAPGGDGSRSPQDWMATQEHIAGLVPRFRALRQPVIAAVHGAASGGGFALALASDIRICAQDARFNAAFVRVGLSGCDIGVSWLLPRVIGAARAFELLLTGRFVDASEAERIGLISRVVSNESLIAEADKAAAAISANSPYGVRMTKKVMWAQLETGSMLAGLALEDATQVTAAMSADHAEAVAAFTEHRAPQFRNT